MIWVLMLIPLTAVTLFSAALVIRLPDFTRSFNAHWDYHKQSDVLSRALVRARNAQVLLDESANPEHLSVFVASLGEARASLRDLMTDGTFAPLSAEAEAVEKGAAAYAAAGADASAAISAVFSKDLQTSVNRLRANLQIVLDPTFIESTNRIWDIAQVFSCHSRLEASREFRDRVEFLRQRIDALPLAFDSKITLQSTVNNVRGEFAELLLACQDLEHAREDAETAYSAVNGALTTFVEKLDALILANVDEYIASETNVLITLSAVVLIVFMLGFAATLVFSARFGRQLSAISQAIRAIATGQRQTEVPFLGSKDELGELAAYVEQFRVNSLKLDDAVVEARTANEAKSQFLAAVSHELRTPLNAILGFSEVIRDGIFGPVPPRYSVYAGDIYASGEALLDQISQILDLSKVELGRQDIAPVGNDLMALLQIALRRLERKIQAKNINVLYRSHGTAHVLFDRGHLLQVISNILDNAVKYNLPDGTITIAIMAGPTRSALRISDTGIGMDTEEVKRAHEPFVQFAPIADSLQGVGLGLSIVARLMEANGGELSIISRKDVGTEVTLLLKSSDVETRNVA